MNNALDLLDLRYEEKKLLSSQSGGLPLPPEKASLFLQGKEIELSDRQGPYLSVFALFDARDNIYYPLTLHSYECSDQGFLRKGELDFINPIAIEVLKSNGIDVSDSMDWIADLSSLSFILESRLQFQDKKRSFQLKSLLNWHPMDAIHAIKSHSILGSLFTPAQRPKRYYGLFSNSRPSENPSSLPKAFLSHRYKDIQDKLENLTAIKVLYRHSDDILPFLHSLLPSLLHRNESVLFLSENENPELDPFLKKYHLKGGTYNLHDWQSPRQVPTVYQKNSDWGPSVPEEAQRLVTAREEYRRLYRLRKQNFQKSTTFLSLLSESRIRELLANNGEVTLLSVGDYELEDFHKDLKFLDTIDRLSEIKKISLNDFLYQGLSCSGSEENYMEIQKLVHEIQEDLVSFQKTLSESSLLDMEGRKIESFAQFEDYGECVNLLAQYTGFPKKYFNIDIDESNLLRLKTVYQERSSTRLLLDSLFRHPLSQEEKEQLLEELRSPSLFIRHQGRKELRSLLSSRTKRNDIEVVVQLLETSLEREKEYQRIVEEGAAVYGDSVRTMNGVVEILSNRSYIQKFRSFQSRKKSFTMENALVKRGLRDRRFAQERLEEYHRYDKVYQELKRKINRYIGYFLEDRKDFLHMSISDMVLFFQRKGTGSYLLFSQYALFLMESKNISLTLQLAIRKRILSGKTLENLGTDFLLSVLESIYLEEKRHFKKMEREWEEKRSSYNHEIHHIHDINICILSSELKECVRHRCSSPRFQDTYQRIKVLSQQKKNIEKADIDFTLPSLRPILQGTADDLKMLSESMCDVLILSNSVEMSDMALLLAISSAKKVVFLEQMDEVDTRTSGYEQTTIDRPSLYLSFFDRRMDKEVESVFRRILAKKGLSLLTQEETFPYFVRDERTGEKSVCFFDLLLPPDLAEEASIDLREHFFFADHRNVVDIDMVQELLDSQAVPSFPKK